MPDEADPLDKIRAHARQGLPRLDRLQEWIRSRPAGKGERRAFIIEFAGMPKAGKSGTIKNVRQYFSSGSKIRIVEAPGSIKRTYEIYTPAEGVSLRTPAVLKQNLVDFNCWAGAYALQELLQARHDNHHDLVILDRGPWDAGCWLEYVKTIRSDHPVSPEDAAEIIDFFQLPHWMTCADLHVVLVVDPAEAAERERRERLITHHGPVSDRTLMTAMKQIYERKFQELKQTKTEQCPHVGEASTLFLDTTKMGSLEVASAVIDRAFDVIDRKVAARVVITVEELWAAIEPFVTRTVRTDQLPIVRQRLPEIVNEARTTLSVDKIARFRKELRDLYFPVPDGLTLFSNRYEADGIINPLRELIQRIANE
jgi:hypothetical protein